MESLCFQQPMKERLKRTFFKILIDAPAIWRAFFIAVPPLAVLFGGRYWICKDLKRGVWEQFFLTTLGELELFTVTFLFVAFGLHLTEKRVYAQRAILIISTLVATSYLILHSVDIGFFLLTGSRLDLDALIVFLHELETVWPVVRSEVGWKHLLAIFLMLGSMLCAALIKVPKVKTHLIVRVGCLALYPLVHIAYVTTPLPTSHLRGLERSLASLLGAEYVIMLKESPLPVEASAVEPLQVSISEPEQPKPNVIIFILESTGLKHTSLGTKLDTTPNLTRLAEEGLWVKDASAIVPHTTKALISILCGDWPQLKTAVPEAQPGGLTPSCLPQLLETNGYRTAFFQPARQTFENRLGLVHAMGFDFFRAKESLNSYRYESSNYFGLDDQAMIDPSIQWLKEGEKPFFITYLTLASHHKYTLPSKIQPKYSGTEERYKHLSTVYYVDQVLGNLIERLEKEDLMRNTLLIVLGDHGEAMGEHGRKQHDLILWQEGLSIPMVLYGPDVLEKTGVIEGVRQQIDILPTVLDITDLRVSQGTPKGTSLLKPVPEDRKTYHACWRERRCLGMRLGNIKFIDHYQNKTWEYFDLSTDPEETNNLASEQDETILKQYRDELRTWKRKEKGRYLEQKKQWKANIVSQESSEDSLATWDGLSLLGCQLQNDKVYRNETPWMRCNWRAEKPIQSMRNVEIRMQYRGKKVKRQTWEPTDDVLPVYRWPTGRRIQDDIPLKIPRGFRGSVKLDIGWSDSRGQNLLTDEGREWFRTLEFKIQ
ncbi:MAG: LTA synthase family protein [Myxococcota bacterium]|nr:LTA synthase family protein [Myxococcota bacterium]